MICNSKDVSIEELSLKANAHYDVTDFKSQGMLRNRKKLNILKTKHYFSMKKNSKPVTQIKHFSKLSFCSRGNY